MTSAITLLERTKENLKTRNEGSTQEELSAKRTTAEAEIKEIKNAMADIRSEFEREGGPYPKLKRLESELRTAESSDLLTLVLQLENTVERFQDPKRFKIIPAPIRHLFAGKS